MATSSLVPLSLYLLNRNSSEEWNRMVGKYCRTFRESEPKLVQDLEVPFKA